MESVPNLATRVTAEAARRDRDSIRAILRIALAAVAVAELFIAIPDLFLGHSPGEQQNHAHITRHLGAFVCAYAVGLLVVALRPAKARAFVPMTVALALAMLGGAVADVRRGEALALKEVQHGLEILGMVLVWLLASRPLWARSPKATSAGADPFASNIDPDGPQITLIHPSPDL
ncbi:MAG: hypothetical protein F2894_00530 [Actinobacteria bacterium]|uniref:Unannotated protein n=1 Tax=freshwater metagenome TaxID=449393 RepID=A0A6J6YFJ2_9ZZZZ|nr:hypothetical protein [Actinomycetota bacterium]